MALLVPHVQENIAVVCQALLQERIHEHVPRSAVAGSGNRVNRRLRLSVPLVFRARTVMTFFGQLQNLVAYLRRNCVCAGRSLDFGTLANRSVKHGRLTCFRLRRMLEEEESEETAVTPALTSWGTKGPSGWER